MYRFRQHFIFRLFWLFMAVHVINCSIDAPDARPDYVPEDLTYNDMESIAEIIFEQVLNIKDAFAEHDENDTEDGSSFSVKKETIHSLTNEVEVNKFFENEYLIIASTFYDEQYSLQFHPEIEPPPPRA
jgi:hypothetical protein